MRTSALKNFRFSVCPHGEGWLSQCGHYADKGEKGQFFEILCRRLLRTTHYNFKGGMYQQRLTFDVLVHIHSTTNVVAKIPKIDD